MSDTLRQELRHTDVPALAMPVGGIGTGGFAVNADASLRQWQLSNIPNHRGALPGTGFWIRTTQIEPPINYLGMLQGTPVADPKAPLVSDGEIPEWMLEASEQVSTFEHATFSGTYPIADFSLQDEGCPVDVKMRVLNPMQPGNVELSSIPCAMVEITVRNDNEFFCWGTIAGSLLNAAGWDGITPITGNTPGLGGNVNRLRRSNGWSGVVMDNPNLNEADEFAGQQVLMADAADAAVLPRATGVDHLVAFLESRALNNGGNRIATAPTVANPQLNSPLSGEGPSAPGTTWLGVVGVPFFLEPGEAKTVRFAIAWHFANRFANVEQFGQNNPQWGASKFFIGNEYALRYPDAVAVADRVIAEWDDLVDATTHWTKTLVDTDLDETTIDRMAAQASLVRSPTCFVGADGRFYGYEGSLGESTWMWSGLYGGSCPLNCTHVWQYEAALAALWPSLERNMRDTEFDIMQAAEGYIPHRLRIPIYLPQMHGELIGGPEEPALDGMLATILKTLRDAQQGAGREWLESRWNNLIRLYDHICIKWDADDDGVLRGIQPSTHDIDLAGVNPFMGSLWLAALRALEEIALTLGHTKEAAEIRARFKSGSREYDRIMYHGGQYIQVLNEGDPVDFQWLTGTLSDQVIGQWWAHQLGLGYLLPEAHVKSALRTVVKNNLRLGFADFEHPYRVYADAADDAGLLMCTWPSGGRPAVPTRYADEVWTGIEYQVAAHCLFEGLEDEGRQVLDAMWTRMNGARRNPYNEIECGDHYARAMAGWTVLEAMSGVHIDELVGVMRVTKPGRWPWVSSTGFGVVTVSETDAAVETLRGNCDLRTEIDFS